MTAPTEAPIDLLYGMAAIGEHIGLTARQVEHLAAKGGLPTFKLGGTVCARRTTLAAHFEAREAATRAAAAGER